MTLATAYAIINSGFNSIAAQSSTISNNIANVNTSGYVREVANQIESAFGGSEVVSISRMANAALLEQALSSTSASAAQSAVSTGLSTLAQSISDSSSSTSTSGANQNGASPSAMIGNLQSALLTYEASPSSTAAAQSVLTAAQNLASSLNTGSQAVSQVEEQADQGMATSVNTINSLLCQFQQANNTVVAGLATGANVSQAEDQREQTLSQLAQEIGVSTSVNSNGSMSIYTDSGVTLFQDTPRTLSFTPTSTFVSGTVGNAVTVDGIPITGAAAPMAIHSGALAGNAQLRDSVAPEYQAQLDQIAAGLITDFSERGPAGNLPVEAGLFTTPTMVGIPTMTAASGLAASIEVNPNVDPNQGGNINLLRDGGISSGGTNGYAFNTTGDASYTGYIQWMASTMSATLPFDPAAGLGASSGFAAYANDSVSWLQGQNQSATDSANYQSAVASQASAALSNATGVNLDTEMTNMLNIENSYTTSAKLLTTVNTMFSALLNAA